MVLVHNSALFENTHSFAKVKLPHENFKALRWNGKAKKFEDQPTDILEQHHFDYDQKEFIDYEMYIPSTFTSGKATVFKIIE